MKLDGLKKIRDGENLTNKEQVEMIIRLSIPAVLAQLSTVIMSFIDASMVGALGAKASAAIGLVSSPTWLLGGLLLAASNGFSVRVAHRIGANEETEARFIAYRGLLTVLGFALSMALLCVAISEYLPVWMGGDEQIHYDATLYFRIWTAAMPIYALEIVTANMIQNSGNVRVPSLINVFMCVLDVIFNMVMIFPGRYVWILGIKLWIPGVGLGVAGAALGTVMAEGVCGLILLYYMLRKATLLKYRKEKCDLSYPKEIKKAMQIAIPLGVEQMVMGSAQIAFTKIVSPLGNISIAANSFGITAESICYMPGYGIGAASTAIIGQTTGAGRADLSKRLGGLCIALAMGIMTVCGALLYFFAPQIMAFLTPETAIRELGAQILRIEAFAEPMFAASIVVAGIFRGIGIPLTTSMISIICMWFIRIPIASLLVGGYGLKGVWMAMCGELIIRGVLFIWQFLKRT